MTEAKSKTECVADKNISERNINWTNNIIIAAIGNNPLEFAVTTNSCGSDNGAVIFYNKIIFVNIIK